MDVTVHGGAVDGEAVHHVGDDVQAVAPCAGMPVIEPAQIDIVGHPIRAGSRQMRFEQGALAAGTLDAEWQGARRSGGTQQTASGQIHFDGAP